MKGVDYRRVLALVHQFSIHKNNNSPPNSSFNSFMSQLSTDVPRNDSGNKPRKCTYIFSVHITTKTKYVKQVAF